MFSKRFYVKIDLQLHAISCPGVWLCAHGYLEATIKTLGYYFRTGAMEPRFPLLCHDRFTMEGYYRTVDSVDELERVLDAEQFDVTLWQNGRRLAYFHGTLADILQPGAPQFSCVHNINAELLMRPSPAFPGILAPKVELSVHLILRDRQQRPVKDGVCAKLGRSELIAGCARDLREQAELLVAPAYTTTATCCCRSAVAQRRQHPVCHTKPRPGRIESLALEQRRPSMCSSHLSSVASSAFATSSPTWSPRNERSIDDVLYGFVDAADHQRDCELCQSYQRTFFPS